MEKILMLFKLGVKYLHRYRRRYAFLFAALVFCFAIVTFITASKDRMYNNVYYSAQSHYAGDVIAVGYNPEIRNTHHIGGDDVSVILDAVRISGINPRHTVIRTLFGNTGLVYFNGNAVAQKYIIGCDWESEEHLFSKMEFASPIVYPVGDEGIIISAPVARLLGAEAGDSIILEVDNRLSQKNTGRFIVKGIVEDSSIFGYYKIYISRLSLNRLLLLDDNDCSTIGFFFDNRYAADRYRSRLNSVLSSMMQTGPLVYDREGMDRETSSWSWAGLKVFLYTMPVYLSEISNLMEALELMTYFLYGMMLIIILVSAAVTYRLILHERAMEMGVMRAIGFFGGDLRMVLWTEVVILGIISLFAGFLLSVVFSIAASFISFSWFPSFEIFLRNGKLTALYLPGTIIPNIILTLLILVAAVIMPSLSASKKNLPSLLSGEPL
ncbi:MAG: ABC transporter permease [Treponema sp.]|nr:ABC transporter permease [Treponema sp.]